ncbi:S-layer homology domain-containing protein [Bifidobacterium choerinum]|uniref:SLH domain-containing protein n=1 Tax=Bifidobacterium choerinum TaxID=35760 RepID=A0A2D3D424_9BIFI|nr:S-layer homology domain-containing protein [Bifidobacterium choerinum]ATU19867.1 hypothetical protein BcFMB_01735 [Bifidobacterium choerinum]
MSRIRKSGRGIAVLSAIGLSLGLFVPSPAMAAVQSPFRDVDLTTPHLDDIRWLADAGISTGWPLGDGTSVFRGMSTVVRQDMAAFLRREAKRFDIANAKAYTPSQTDWRRFKDVNRSTPHAEDILWLASTGITTGYADGTFRGMTPVYRQDMAAFLKRLADKSGKDLSYVTPKTDFTDVSSRTPHVSEVQWLGGSGISQGYKNADGSWRFGGMTPVYRQDMAAFIHRLDNHINCEAKVTPVVVQEAWDEQVVDTPAWDEVIPAVTKVVHHDAVTREEPVYEMQTVPCVVFTDGYKLPYSTFMSMSAKEQFALGMAHGTWTAYDDTIQVQVGTKTVVVTPAWDETVVITPEQTVHHEATYKTVHHDAVIENRTEFSNCRI